MKNFEVEGGLGRLAQFPKKVCVSAPNETVAAAKAMSEIRALITLEDFNGDPRAPFLSKIINITSVKEYFL